jgi:hypothetical protein
MERAFDPKKKDYSVLKVKQIYASVIFRLYDDNLMVIICLKFLKTTG